MTALAGRTRRFACGVVLSWAAAQAPAQVRPGTVLPEALKDVAPATGLCRADEGPAGTVSAAPPSPAPDLSCMATLAELAPWIGHADAVWVDVRVPAEPEPARIEGSLPLTVTALMSKAYLKSKTVVLVGSGKAERELYAACAGLKAQGFQRVKVLQGGLPTWLAGGRPVVGRGGVADALVRLSAPELWLESHFDANLVLVVRSQAGMQEQLHFSKVIADAGAPAVKAVMAQRRKELKNEPLAAVVLVVAPDTPAPTLLQLRQAIAPVPLLVHADGSDVFMRQMKQQQLVWAAQARGPKQPACGR
jgi:rhodanese-related sulfurtransferase